MPLLVPWDFRRWNRETPVTLGPFHLGLEANAKVGHSATRDRPAAALALSPIDRERLAVKVVIDAEAQINLKGDFPKCVD